MAGLSEETGVQLVQELGRLTGKVGAFIDNQNLVNKTFADKIEAQDEALDAVKSDINGYKKLVRGLVFGIGLGGTSLGAAITKWASTGGVIDKLQ